MNGTDNDDADYAYPPFPLPAFSQTTPNSPTCYSSTGGRPRTVPTTRVAARAQTAPSSPMAKHNKGLGTVHRFHRPFFDLTNQRHPSLDRTDYQRPCQGPTDQRNPSLDLTNQKRPSVVKQASVDELRSTVHTVTSSMEHSTRDVRHLGQRMVKATELMSDSVEENAQALNLLAEVVDKLQGLIVASKPPEAPRPKPFPPPPARFYRSSSTPSSSSSSPSSSSSSCLHDYEEGQWSTREKSSSGPGLNGRSKGKVTIVVPPKTEQAQLSNGTACRPGEDPQDHDTTGCLSSKKHKKKKKGSRT